MKNLFIASILILVTTLSYAQETSKDSIPDSRDINKNELSINAFNLVAFGIIDIAYERVIDENSTWAVEGYLYPNNDDYYGDGFFKNSSVTGKYKHFFSSTYARGFYVNGFGMLSNGEYDVDYYLDQQSGDYIYKTENYTDFAIGFGLGGKFVSQGGFLLDLNAGIGRNLFSDNSPTIVGQFMINLGYRF